jgi:pimeloyl-ACP methyl ester carboxylesterase
MPYAAIDDSLSLYYHIKGQGMPVVFIHPFVMGHNVFMHQEALAEQYQTIFYDIAGHGRSTPGDLPLTIDLLANHLKNLLDHLDIEKAVVCGYSHGGLIAQEFALQHPERTIAVILSGGYSELNNFPPIFFIKTVMYLAKIRQVALAAKLQAKLNKHFPEDEEKIYRYGKKTDAQRAYEYCKTGLDYKSTFSLRRLTMPILLVYGTLETPMHHYQDPFRNRAPQTKVVYIKGGTHQVPPQFFSQFNKAVDLFLRPIKNRWEQGGDL